MKQCSKCKRILSESKFYYRRDTDKLNNKCIDCHKKHGLQYYQKNKERLKKNYEKNRENILEKQREYARRPEVKERRRIHRQKESTKQKEIEYSNRYRQKNLEKARARDKKYCQEHKEEKKEYYQKNRERILARNKVWCEKNIDKRKKYHKKYHKEHLFEHRLHQAKRQNKLKSKNIEHAFTDKEWEQKIASTNGICLMCSKPYSDGYGLTMDHNPPLSKAPDNFVYTIEHIQPLCMSCNSSKGNKMDIIKTAGLVEK